MAPILVARAETQPIVFQSTETPPFWSASLSNNGVGGSMLRLMSEAAGIPYSIDYLPVKRFRTSEASFIVGDPDIITSKTQRTVIPIGLFRLAFFYYKPHHPIMNFQGMRALRGNTMGVLRGTLEDKQIFLRNGITIEESDSNESLLRKLKRERLDFCIMVAGAGRHAIKKEFPNETENFAEYIVPDSQRPIAIMIDTSQAHGKALAKRYRNVLAATVHSRAYYEILEKHYGKNNVRDTYFTELFSFVKSYDDALISQ
ncbi:MAG: transporter substrate-binding domain-containing protein [Gallionellaceae bacterium]|nr:transporter substrate-binding domain-containing protein [Gallionellaceae bacterium]